MLKAGTGDLLYIIIFAVLMLAGGVEKYMKAKRQQQKDRLPRQPQPYSDDDDEEQPATRQAPPQTLEEMMRRMLQTAEMLKKEEEKDYPEEAQSLEIIPETSVRKYQPIVSQIASQPEKEAFVPVEEKKEFGFQGDEFDIRQAVIASEILNRKYF